VLSNAMFHHLPDTRAALRRLSQLVRPGGTLAIAGFLRTERRDLPWALTTAILRGVAIRVRGKWPHTAPQAWPPRDSIRELRQAAREVLPGSRVRLLLLGRYLLTWTRPRGPVRPGWQPEPLEGHHSTGRNQ
jgi:SAM-dependent methyltransferase